ncbi:sialidase family protein [Flavobacterium geliluteum]|uniref:Exo-alpha-sialidase n=1 Tax=Flavobacterium geliluteum TaxID=2816120 RepID=A0A941AW04_9FLAO|nr:sialidase family protein [Flavobacterium geliluteum]MBP4136885.1 exo-alpha-sialidase [Flavobacterium geliluteum]
MISTVKKAISLVVLMCFSVSFAQKTPEAIHIMTRFIADSPVTANSHAATLVEVKPNKLMAAWFGGKYEGAKDVGIYCATFKENKWSEPQNLVAPAIIHKDTLPCWNPVLFKSKSKCLYLFYKVGKNPREWVGAMITSKDDGNTWSAPQYLPKGILGPIKNKPIETTPGTILCGSSTESVENNQWRVHVESYNETNNTWQKILVDNKNNFDIIQPTFLIHPNTKIQMLSRSKHNKLIASWSDDEGKNWTKTDSINVVNSNSGIDAVTLPNHSFLLVNNPLPQGKDWFNGRNVLDVEYSKEGIIWKKIIDLENQPEGEFSYPAIIQSFDKKIHVLYTYNRKYIKHVTFELKS